MPVRFARIALALIALSCGAVLAQGTAYPTKPVRLVVPFPPAGTTDIIARAAAQKLSEAWGQQVVVDNRPGAAGNIGSELVSKAAPDGYTLEMGTVGTHAINPSLYAKMPYDHVRDFVPIVLVAGVPNVLVVNPSLPVNSVQELIRARSTSHRREAGLRFTFRARCFERSRASTSHTCLTRAARRHSRT